MNLFKKKPEPQPTNETSPAPVTKPIPTPSEIESQIDQVVATYLLKCNYLLALNSSIKYWQSVIKSICYAESSFNPYETYYESGLADKNGNDPATGMRYLSEGLMQLSYSDALPNRYACEFDITTDKNKTEKDHSKTIFSVQKNIECGMKILDKLVGKYHKFIYDDGNYWAVLKPSNKRHQIYLDKFNEYMSMETKPDIGAANPQREDNLPKEENVKKTPELWYPKRVTKAPFDKLSMRTIGTYPYKYPQGAIVHYTSGRNKATKTLTAEQISESFVKTSVSEQKFCYFVIDMFGKVYQQFPLDKWGYHAGESKWTGLKGTVSDELVGIEIMSAGRVTKEGTIYKAWFDETYSEDEVRFCYTNQNIQQGHYNKYSMAQEAALIELLKWLKSNGNGIFEYKYVLGHDEVAPDRKDDPGGSLSMTMPALRLLLEKGA